MPKFRRDCNRSPLIEKCGDRLRQSHDIHKDNLPRLLYPNFQPNGQCPKCPPMCFAGVTAETAYKSFVGKPRCGNSDCRACYPIRQQQSSEYIHYGVQKLLDQYGSGQSGFVTQCGEKDWPAIYEHIRQQVKNHPNTNWWAAYKADGVKTAWSNVPIPDSVEMPLEQMYDNALEVIGKTNENTVDPYFSPNRSPTWRPTNEYRKSQATGQWTRIGAIPHHEAEVIQRVLKDANGIDAAWVGNLPDSFRWKVEWSMRHLTPSQICKVFHNIGLRPRKGERIEDMVNRLWALWAVSSPRQIAAA